MARMTMRVAAFTRYGRQAAATRQRLLQYLPALSAAGIEVEYHALLGDDYVRSLAGDQSYSRRAVAASYWQRMKALSRGVDADLVWVYAELFPYLPGFFERLAFKSGKPVIVDFDDAFFHNYDNNPNPLVRGALRGKLEPLLKGAAACCCGNEYLRAYASRFCERSIILPTVVDAEAYRPDANGRQPDGPIVIGWIGSPTTSRFLLPLVPMLAQLCQERGVKVRVVGAGREADRLRFPGLELVEWSEEREILEVQAMDIGIMPLPDEGWARGKSGYKLIQYMACGLPVVASPVGVNSEIVRHGESGFLATSVAEWRAALEQLILDKALRQHMGASGRRRVEENYSLAVQAPRLVELIRTTIGSQPDAAPTI